ncbi:MAG TPA: LysM peptidoglycan-binding domain-containing protein [Levilinea sp.]|nr:LysM peptidoglycan-binding domain-containing protein [Levilinea sp.]
MFTRIIPRIMLLIILLAGTLQPATNSQAAAQAEVTAYDLIVAMNTLRMSYGLPALVEDPIINAVASSTAQIMAANQMSWHIGDARGRIQAAGYGGGAKVWATENFAVGSRHTIDTIMLAWADPSHMIPAVNPAYCHVGAGTAKAANGMTYYVLQAAYISGKACGPYTDPDGFTPSEPGTNPRPAVPQIIMPVKIATPDANGEIYHVVEPGQSFWAIAVAYRVTIRDIEIWNNISKDTRLRVGKRLFIPGENTAGFSTPTPVGMVQVSTPGPDGSIVHEVQSHQTLSTISQTYQVRIQTILDLNGIRIDWPLSIGQKLLIYPGDITPSPTPRPLTPIEKLTPAADGKYYHTVRSGENAAWIARLYDVALADLLRWNNLSQTSILQPEQQLVLQVTPPATATITPGPATETPVASPTPANTKTLTPRPTETPNPTPTEPVRLEISGPRALVPWVLGAGGAIILLILVDLVLRRRR